MPKYIFEQQNQLRPMSILSYTRSADFGYSWLFSENYKSGRAEPPRKSSVQFLSLYNFQAKLLWKLSGINKKF